MLVHDNDHCLLTSVAQCLYVGVSSGNFSRPGPLQARHRGYYVSGQNRLASKDHCSSLLLSFPLFFCLSLLALLSVFLSPSLALSLPPYLLPSRLLLFLSPLHPSFSPSLSSSVSPSPLSPSLPPSLLISSSFPPSLYQ